MSLKQKIQLYILGLIIYARVGNASEMAKIYPGISHDSFTRLFRSSWDSQKRLLESAKSLVGVRGGYLILDDTLIEKPYSTEIDGVGWHYDKKAGRSKKGLCIVALIWTDGIQRIPICYEIYRKGGKSKVEIALDLVSIARNRLQLKPEAILFDSWYACKAIFKRLEGYGWKFACRLGSNRYLNGKQLKKHKKTPYWTQIGKLRGGIKVKVVKHRSFYFATNRLSLERSKILELYRKRNMIEEYFRSLKTIFCLSGCQVRSYEGQRRYIGLCILAHLALEKLQLELGMTIYEVATQARLQNDQVLKRLQKLVRNAA